LCVYLTKEEVIAVLPQLFLGASNVFTLTVVTALFVLFIYVTLLEVVSPFSYSNMKTIRQSLMVRISF